MNLAGAIGAIVILTKIQTPILWDDITWEKYIVMKQLDVDVSPPANIMSFRLTLTHMTIDLDPRDL